MLDAVERYYGTKLAEHGPTARGVDWNDEASQTLRFAQLVKVCELRDPFTINDYGCGYGALARYLDDLGCRFGYTGFDISPPMVQQARALHGDSDHTRFVEREDELEPADYTVASGIFNVKLDAADGAWRPDCKRWRTTCRTSGREASRDEPEASATGSRIRR